MEKQPGQEPNEQVSCPQCGHELDLPPPLAGLGRVAMSEALIEQDGDHSPEVDAEFELALRDPKAYLDARLKREIRIATSHVTDAALRDAIASKLTRAFWNRAREIERAVS